MGAGLQVFGADGTLLLYTSDRLCRCLGELRIGPSGGSFNIPVRSGKTAWICLVPPLDAPYRVDPVGITLTGSVVQWERQEMIFVLIYGEC